VIAIPDRSSFDQRAYQDKILAAHQRYVDTYGEPPSEAAFSPSATAWIDTCDRLGGDCDQQRAWQCRGAVNASDGRCPHECHQDERRPSSP
jgi:hypothetical protein